jgi:hypothetical protein
MAIILREGKHYKITLQLGSFAMNSNIFLQPKPTNTVKNDFVLFIILTQLQYLLLDY